MRASFIPVTKEGKNEINLSKRGEDNGGENAIFVCDKLSPTKKENLWVAVREFSCNQN